MLKKIKTWLVKKQKEQAQKQQLVKVTCKTIDQKIKEQEAYLQDIEKKIKLWHKRQNDEVKRYILQKKDIKKLLKQKKERQQQQFSILKQQCEVIPKAIEEAHIQLTTIYQGQKGANLLTELIQKIDKEQQNA